MLRRDKNGKRMAYDHMVDWFSFGCCLAEFISGTNPFRSETALNFGLGMGKKTKVRRGVLLLVFVCVAFFFHDIFSHDELFYHPFLSFRKRPLIMPHLR
jgi:hypothetical protein